MFFLQFCLSPGLYFFPVLFLHLFCINFTAGTQNACNDLLTGTISIIAMLHNEKTDQFYLLTSSGYIFIEPISNFDPASSPPTLTLTEAKYSMPTEWSIYNHPQTVRADIEEFLTFWVNQDKPTETLLCNVWQETNKICVHPGVKLDKDEARVEDTNGICAFKSQKGSPDFWLGFNSRSYTMVKVKSDGSNYVYCPIYRFPDGKSVTSLVYINAWKDNSECLGVALGGGKPRCGVVHKQGNVAVVIQNSSTVYVYRNILSNKDKNRLNEKQEISSLPQPTRHQINEFIKCEGLKTKTNPSDVNLKVEQTDVNQPKPNKPKPDTPMKQKLFLIILGVLFLVAIVFGLVVKFKLIQAFPWKRKRKRKGKTVEKIISQAYSIAISKASVIPRESALQQILQKAPRISKLKVDKKQENKKLTAPGVVTKMLDTFKKRLVNSVKAAKKHKKKRKKKRR